MTYTIQIGKEIVWDVSYTTREIFNIVRKKLESGKEGSKFKYFHLLNNEGTIKYKKLTLDSILDDFKKVKQELNLVKCPVASLYIKDMEIEYAYGRIDGDEWIWSKDKGFGIDKKGMFVRIGDVLEYSLSSRPSEDLEHFKELKKGDEYFDKFLLLGKSHIREFEPTEQILNKVDKITHNFKSVNMVHEKTFEKLEEFVEKAKKEKKSIKIYH